jgi:hypothetical protein
MGRDARRFISVRGFTNDGLRCVVPVAPPRLIGMRRRIAITVGIEDDSGEETRLGGPRLSLAALAVLGKELLDLGPLFAVDNRLVLPGIDRAFVLNFAYIYMVAQDLVERPPGKARSPDFRSVR